MSTTASASPALVKQQCSCPCGAAKFVLSGRPLARFYCHCKICQALYRQPYADATAWWGRSVVLATDHGIQFKRYKLPPALRRGTCPACGLPVVGYLRLAPFLQLAFIPAQNVSDPRVLPAPSAHIFYHRRVEDSSDSLPKISGYWRSEWMVMKAVLGRRSQA